MAQQVVHARVLFNSTNVYTDPSSNDFYFEATGAGTSIDFDAILAPQHVVTSFYNDTATGAANPVAHYMSTALDRSTNGAQMAFYDITAHLNGQPAGSPVRTFNWTLGPEAASSDLPPGCAVTLAYRRDYGSDVEHIPGARPRARDRGRVYIGPLNDASILITGGQVATTLNDSLEKAFAAMAATKNVGGANQFNLVQWSRAKADVGAVRWYAVEDAITYQRRRADDLLNRVHTWIPVP